MQSLKWQATALRSELCSRLTQDFFTSPSPNRLWGLHSTPVFICQGAGSTGINWSECEADHSIQLHPLWRFRHLMSPIHLHRVVFKHKDNLTFTKGSCCVYSRALRHELWTSIFPELRSKRNMTPPFKFHPLPSHLTIHLSTLLFSVYWKKNSYTTARHYKLLNNSWGRKVHV